MKLHAHGKAATSAWRWLGIGLAAGELRVRELLVLISLTWRLQSGRWHVDGWWHHWRACGVLQPRARFWKPGKLCGDIIGSVVTQGRRASPCSRAAYERWPHLCHNLSADCTALHLARRSTHHRHATARQLFTQMSQEGTDICSQSLLIPPFVLFFSIPLSLLSITHNSTQQVPSTTKFKEVYLWHC